MGVSGSGKTTIASRLADVLGWRFADADDFHPPANVAKMSRGEPLNDDDRRPWLQALSNFLSQHLQSGQPCVLACSALKASYRQVLHAHDDRVRIVYLKGSRELLQQRMTKRQGHFMPGTLLDSQLATLEEPRTATALTCDIRDTPDKIVAHIRTAFGI